jgi:hypothetical protein
MRIRTLGLIVVVGLLAFGTLAPATAKPTRGSFTGDLTIGPALVEGTDITLSGTLTANVSQFSVQDGHIVAIATVSGTVTATSPTLGTATLVLSGTRIVLNANVQADCQGHLHIDFRGVLQVRGTLTFTSTTGSTITFDLNETIPLSGSLDYTAQSTSETALICDIATLLNSSASQRAVVDKLNTLLKKL